MDGNEKYGQKLVTENQGKEIKENAETQINELYRQIGKLKVERDFFFWQVGTIGAADRKTLVDPKHPELCIQRQCELLGISRSSYYYEPKEMALRYSVW